MSAQPQPRPAPQDRSWVAHEAPVRLVPRWDTIVPAGILLAAAGVTVGAWDDVFNGLDLLALQLAVAGAALLPRPRR